MIVKRTNAIIRLEIKIFEKSGSVPGFDLLTWAGSWACRLGKTQEGQKMPGPGSR